MEALLGILFGPLRVLPWRVLMLISPRSRSHDLEIFDLTARASRSADHFARVDAALDVIGRHQSRRLLRIKRDVHRFLIVDQAGPEFWPRLHACVLTPRGLSLDDEEVAVTIVHEAMHARLYATGIPYHPELRDRIERCCVKQEIAFAHSLPRGETLAETSRAQLETPWWTPDALFERRLSQLEEAGAPKWLIRGLRGVFAPH